MLQKASMANTFRHDYNSQNRIHVIYIPSVLHEFLLQSILQNIIIQLEEYRKYSIKPFAEFVAGIISGGPADLTSDEGYYSPEKQFLRKEHHFPGLVIEMAFLQSKKRNGKDLARLAKSCVLWWGGCHHN